jgi:iron complex outermembrane receptor protein
MKRTIMPTFAFAMFSVVAFLLLGFSANAQQRKLVTGTVRDQSGLALPAVTVAVKGSKSGGVFTDDAGNFSIRADANATLVFSSVGYDSKEVPVGEGSNLSVQLSKNNKELSEAIVTGFGVKKDVRKLSYSATQIQGSELVATNNSNIGDALQGKVAGVTITQGAGGPSSSSRIQIRGNARLNQNTEPLVVIDGILLQPGTTGADSWGGGQDFGNIIKDLNPDDYESITVLKGSAASALYGSQALNGVLLIQTKKGRARKGLGVTYNQTVSFDKAYKMPDLQNTYGGGLSSTFAKDASGNDVVDISASAWPNPNGGYSYGPAFDGHMVKDLDGRMVPWKANNALKEFFQTGKYINTNVSTEGGNENANFRASYTNLYNSSVVPNNSFNKNSFALRGTSKLSSALSLDASVNYTTTKTLNPIIQGGGGTSNPIGGILYFAPRNAPISYFKSNFTDPVRGGVKTGSANDPYYFSHIFWPMIENNLSQTENLLLADLDLTVKFTPWLTGLVRTNVQNYNDVTENKQLGEGANFSGGSYEIDQSSYKTTRVQGLLTANKELNNDFALTATVGGEQQSFLGGPISKSMTNGGLTAPGLYFIANSASAPTTTVGTNPKSVLAAVYAYGDLTWKNMLTFNFSVRNDWSSTLSYADGHGHWTYAYPSLGLAWVFTELPKFKNSNSILSFGKLRASVGWTGYSADPYVTNSTGNYGSVGTFNNPGNSNQTLYSFSDGQGNYNTTLGNQALVNELAREIEFGADLRFLKNRVGVDIAYYKKNSFNQILSLSADQESGISGRTINAGNIQNQGVEILLNASPIRSRDFSWDMTVNFATNKNKVISLYPGVTNYQLQLAFGADVAAYAIAGKEYGTVTTGYGFATYHGKVSASNGQRVIGSAPYGTTGGYYSYMRSQDYDGSTKTLGNIMPKFLWGTFQTFTYKSFSLGIQVDSKVGGLMASATDQYGSETGNFKNSLPGRNAKLGGITYTDNNNVQHDDGIIPNGVLADGIMVGSTDLGGMTYAAAVKAGLLKPIPAYAYYENLTQWSSGIREVSVFDNSWVALRQVSVSYGLPASLYKKAHLNGLKFTLTGRNLFYIWKNAKDGINPEGLYNNQAASFAEGGGLPYIRSMGATLNASF